MVKVSNQYSNKKNIVVVAPHADDEILGCGGTIAKHIKFGHQVHIIICTNANKGNPEMFKQKDINIIRKEAIRSHKVLGKINTIFLDFPAPNLDIFPASQIADKLFEYFIKIKPHILYIPFFGDLHNDHKTIHHASMIAAREKEKLSIKKILSYEVLSETDVNLSSDNFAFCPNYFVNITNYINLKIKSMNCYKSQLKKYPNSRSIETIKALSIYRGAGVGFKNAEAFVVNKIIDEK